jgi:hypothetical protein
MWRTVKLVILKYRMYCEADVHDSVHHGNVYVYVRLKVQLDVHVNLMFVLCIIKRSRENPTQGTDLQHYFISYAGSYMFRQ